MNTHAYMHASYLQFHYSCIKLSGCKSHHYINLSISRNNTCVYVGTVMHECVCTDIICTSHWGDNEGRMVLYRGELKLKINGYITLQGECLVACAADWSCWKTHVPRKFGCAHNWIGMDRYQQILLILYGKVINKPSISHAIKSHQ